MKTEKFYIYLGNIRSCFKKAFLRLKEYGHLSCIRYRAWRINRYVDKTMGDKLRTLAAKADAIEQFYLKHCNPEKTDKFNAKKNQKWYNKFKNDLKKELLLINYSY